ncbi:thermonuclease family protein [Roseibium limicola]|uniref:Thermonuclease family protein n=1 Tax=Roseibium limicola TaxID=2816037 RepID=A0A939EN74_9HYPH|nr:thermonuclease family protein [Roseibium limicola]MBO0345255.1 thermonuclease family protein [Roseibium limicola]
MSGIPSRDQRAAFFVRVVIRLGIAALLSPALLTPGLFADASAANALRIIDGDTLELHGEKIRLDGIDAPEHAQTCISSAGVFYPCGQDATSALNRLTQRATVRCEGKDYDVYKRRIATCYANGRNLNSDMVRMGQALAYRKYSRRYIGDEMAARAAKRGLWAGVFDEPWAYRQGKRQLNSEQAPRSTKAASANRATSPRCPIKGNISKNGRLYHLPGTNNYDRTRINETKGERWFCSEIQALAAGWRRAR